jgi:cell division protein YceG involved in septum cleavage
MWGSVLLVTVFCFAFLALINTKTHAISVSEIGTISTTTAHDHIFPIGVNPSTKTITENPDIDVYIHNYIASNHTPTTLVNRWHTKLLARLMLLNWYQNLASPISRVIVIESGKRKEEVVQLASKILDWDTTEQAAFLEHIAAEVPVLPDGKLYPGTYVVEKDADAETLARVIADRFNAEVRSRYSSDIEDVVPLRDALIIASLIEREAYDFEDMRYISGIIWNRLFIDMRLQLDATMQYAKTTNMNMKSPSVTNWWPVPTPRDKAINSPYNTYKHAGLPPGPIANPSIDAIIAALNPRETDCLFYFHTDDGTFTCTETYAEHVAALTAAFGQGK